MKNIRVMLLIGGSALAMNFAAGPADAYGLGDFFGPVPAQIRAAGSGASIAGDLLSQHYAEHLNGSTTVLDSEQGTNIPGLTFALQGQGSHFGFGASLSVARGTTDYIGALENLKTGATTPYDSTTQNHILNMQLSVDEGFSPLKDVAILPSFFVGRQHWYRQMLGPYGYDELYNSVFYGGGLSVACQLPAHFVFAAGYNWGRTSGASMQSDYGGLPTFDLGDRPWRVANARLTWRIPHHTLAIYVNYRLTQFGYGQSPMDPYGFVEPNSTTQWNTVSLGILKIL